MLFRLGLQWLESILACQTPTYLLSRCHYCFISYNTYSFQPNWWALSISSASVRLFCMGSVALDRKLVVDWVPSCDLEDSAAEEVSFFIPYQLFFSIS